MRSNRPCNSREEKSYPLKRVLLCLGAVLRIDRNPRNSAFPVHAPAAVPRQGRPHTSQNQTPITMQGTLHHCTGSQQSSGTLTTRFVGLWLGRPLAPLRARPVLSNACRKTNKRWQKARPTSHRHQGYQTVSAPSDHGVAGVNAAARAATAQSHRR